MGINVYPQTSSTIQQAEVVSATANVFTLDLSSSSTAYELDLTSLSTFESNPTPSFVGSWSSSLANNATSPWVISPFTGMSPKTGDMIVLAVASASTLQYNTTTPSGFTLVTNTYANDSVDMTLSVFYKTYNGDTTISLANGNTLGNGTLSAAVSVWRNAGSAPTITGTPSAIINTGTVSFNSITTTSTDTLVVAVGASSHTAGNTLYALSGVDQYKTAMTSENSTSADGTLAIGGYIKESAGSTNPGTWSLQTVDAISYSAASILLGFKATTSTDTYASSISFSNIPSSKTIKKFDILANSSSSTYKYKISYNTTDFSNNLIYLLENKRFNQSFFAYFSKLYRDKTLKVQKTEIINASRIWTSPDDVDQIEVLICGGGGGGNATSFNGGGGSADLIVLDVKPATSYTVTIGAGGAVGTNGSSSSIINSTTGEIIYSIIGGYTAGASAGTTPGGAGALKGGNGGHVTNATYFGTASQGFGIYGFGQGGTAAAVTGASLPGRINTGNGGSGNAAGGSGVCIIKYWSESEY